MSATICTLCGGRRAVLKDYRCYEMGRDGRTGGRFGGVRYFPGRATDRARRSVGWSIRSSWRTDDYNAYRAGLRERLKARKR